MKLQRIGGALFLAVGLLSFPIVLHAEEEGSLSGQHARDGEGHRAKDNEKKHTGAAGHPQEGSGAPQQATTAHDSHGKHTPQQEETDEGSH